MKRTVKVEVPQKILNAKVATLDELLDMLDGYASQVSSLSSTTVKITFTSGKAETGKLQEYRSAPGYILLERPDRIRLNIQNPLTKTTIVELASVGDDFSFWYPRENKFFQGKNSARSFDLAGEAENPAFSARPIHFFEAILPQAIHVHEPDRWVAIEEDQDAQAKYYVISFYRETAHPNLIPIRKIWIERSNLTVARQVMYAEDGRVASSIWYLRVTSEGVPLPLSMRIEHPLDGYIIDMEIKTWNLNPQLPENAFILTPPAGAQRIILKEKQRSGAR